MRTTILCLLSLACSPVAAFVASHARLPQTRMQSSAAVKPQMMLPPTVANGMLSVDISSIMLAEEIRKTIKSEGDEILEEIFINFPTFFSGGVFAIFALNYFREVLEVDLPTPVAAAGVFGGGVTMVVLSQLGVLNFLSGFVAKVALDGWNLFANVALPGALLKY